MLPSIPAPKSRGRVYTQLLLAKARWGEGGVVVEYVADPADAGRGPRVRVSAGLALPQQVADCEPAGMDLRGDRQQVEVRPSPVRRRLGVGDLLTPPLGPARPV